MTLTRTELVDHLVMAVYSAEQEATIASETGYASYAGGDLYEGILRERIAHALEGAL